MNLKSTRKNEVLLTVISNLSLQIITALCGFILPPLIVSTFGSAINGMVSSVSQFIAYLNLVEAGVGGAAIAALYKPLSIDDTNERNAILSATSQFYNRAGILFVILVIILSILYPIIVGNEVDHLQSAVMVLILGITGAAEFFLIGKYRVLLTADKKIYIISIIQIIALIVSTVISVILIKIHSNILIVKLLSAIVYLGRYVFISFYVKKHYLNLSFKELPDKTAISQSKNVLVHQLGGLVVFNSPLVIITIFCSLKDASVYTVYALVFNAVNHLLGSFYNGFQAFFGESLVKDSLDKTQKLFNIYETLFFVLSFCFYSCAYILIIPFMKLYTAKMTDAVYIQPMLGFLFCLVGLANNLRRPCDVTIMAAGHYKQTQWRSLLESIINVFASILFTIKFGFIGVLLGSLTSYSYRMLDIIIYSNRHILERNFLFSIIKILILFCIYIPLIIFLLHFNISIQSYFSWFTYALICGFVFGIPVFVYFLLLVKEKKKKI